MFQQFQAVLIPTKYNIKSGDILCRVCVDQHRYFKPTHHLFLPKPNQNISTALSQHIAENLTRGSFKVQHIANIFWRITGVFRVHPLGARKSLKDFVVIHPVEILSRKRENKVFSCLWCSRKTSQDHESRSDSSSGEHERLHRISRQSIQRLFWDISVWIKAVNWLTLPSAEACHQPDFKPPRTNKKKPKKQVTKKKKTHHVYSASKKNMLRFQLPASSASWIISRGLGETRIHRSGKPSSFCQLVETNFVFANVFQRVFVTICAVLTLQL